MQDAAAFYARVIIALITPIIFRAKPRIARRTAAALTTKRTGRATGSIAAKVVRCATGTVVAVEGVIWVRAFTVRGPGNSCVASQNEGAQKNEQDKHFHHLPRVPHY